MSIERIGRTQHLACDVCGEEGDPFPREDFNDMITAAKADGWQIAQQRGYWTHSCPDCAEDTETPLQRAQRLFGR